MSLYDTIARQCGEATAEAVRLRLGGMRIKIPKTWTPEHLLNVAGEEHARALIATFSGEDLHFPQHRLSGKKRTARIQELRATGLTQNQIARQVGCGESWVRQVLRGERNRDQPDLLDSLSGHSGKPCP